MPSKVPRMGDWRGMERLKSGVLSRDKRFASARSR